LIRSHQNKLFFLLSFIFFTQLGISQQGKIYTAIEIAIYPARSNAVFSKKHPTKFLLIAKNNLGVAQDGIISYEIKNKFEEIMQTGKMQLQVAAGKTFKESFSINFSKKGTFKIDFDINFPDYTEKQTGKFTYQ
jgi:hypothetical protein